MPSRSYDARIAFCDVGLLLPFDDLLLLDVKYILIRNKKKRAKYHTSMEANNTARTTGTNHQNEKDIASSLAACEWNDDIACICACAALNWRGTRGRAHARNRHPLRHRPVRNLTRRTTGGSRVL